MAPEKFPSASGPSHSSRPLDLSSLNQSQLQAVQHAPKVPLQILAGPGSGKTKVLTSRIAHLILHHHLAPSSICAVTFTNKAANEMRNRLIKLIGKQSTSEVRMGTFHALCALFLRKYSKIVGLEDNFTICDADESKKLITMLLKPHKETLERSKQQRATKNKDNDSLKFVAGIYEKYERLLRQSNSLDFDDLLLFGVQLFTQHKRAVSWCQHILVDEFQDTNVMQYQLMKAIGVARCVTVVGDPDQSIYGWRSAEVGNLANMREDFEGTEQIFLEENYRSTGSILKASLAIVTQDQNRIQRSLHTSHPAGIAPTLRSFATEQDEATFIAVEIKRLVAHMGGVLGWGDFVILLRFNALSRVIEGALQKEGIPSRVLGGHRFFERLEIKDLLAYLQLIDNPDFNPAFTRAVNVPPRGVGEKTIADITTRAEKADTPYLTLVEKIHELKVPDIKPPVRRKLVPFIKTIRELRELAVKGMSPADLIRRLVDLIHFRDHLEKTQPDWESRWENVQELITFASEVETDILDIGNAGENSDSNVNEARSARCSSCWCMQIFHFFNRDTPLRLFLQASMLSSEGDSKQSADNEKVTISSCHAAKGLEWPVVMIPAVEQGTFPFYRTEDVEEERRLLYVACTRAQGLLYLTHATRRKIAGETKTKELSPFVSTVIKDNVGAFTTQKPEFSPSDRIVISTVLGRQIPDEKRVQHQVAEFHKSASARHYISEDDTSGRSSHGPIVAWHPVLTKGQPNATFASCTNLFIKASNPPHELISKPLTPLIATPTAPILSHTVSPPLRRPKIPTVPTVHPIASTLVIGPPAVAMPSCAPLPSMSSTDSHTAAGTMRGTKRRLGMGRGTVGYANKKFRPPT
ncbi:P-loop containing nucleoside triphosphate hydrolase protein [Infundibulicybe gibba]|nr:P-loop containing nucleoside triphosphate hydrolase protein [Infundibulicybe gibba]